MAQRGNPEVGELLKKSTCWQKQQSANWTVGDIHGAMHVPCIDLTIANCSVIDLFQCKTPLSDHRIWSPIAAMTS